MRNGTLCWGAGLGERVACWRLAREKANECLGWPHGDRESAAPFPPCRSKGRRPVVHCRDVHVHSTAAGLKRETRRDRGSRVEQQVVLWCSRVIFPPRAIARESVGQLLPKSDPTKLRLAISSRQEDLDIGSGKSKKLNATILAIPASSEQRAAFGLSEKAPSLVYSECNAPATLSLDRPLPSHGRHIIHRTTMMRSHKSLLLLDVQCQSCRQEPCRCCLWQMPSPWADCPIAGGRPAQQASSSMVSNPIQLFDLRRQFADCVREPGLGSAGDDG